VVAIAVGFGMIPLAAPNFFRDLPHDLQPLLESGILLCALVAVMLNAFFNGVGSKAAAETDAAAVASSAACVKEVCSRHCERSEAIHCAA
jgi:xanthine/uracil permease